MNTGTHRGRGRGKDKVNTGTHKGRGRGKDKVNTGTHRRSLYCIHAHDE